MKCIVAVTNANGEPDLFFVKIEGTDEQIENGYHCDAAKDAAAVEGHEPFLIYDENNSAGKAMLPLFAWETASTVSI